MAFHLTEQGFDATIEAASENDDAIIVHGWVQRGGFWHVHGWVETGKGVLDLTETHDPQDKEEYYKRLGIDPALTKRYDRVQFFTLFAETAGAGPFDPEFEASTPPGK